MRKATAARAFKNLLVVSEGPSDEAYVDITLYNLGPSYLMLLTCILTIDGSESYIPLHLDGEIIEPGGSRELLSGPQLNVALDNNSELVEATFQAELRRASAVHLDAKVITEWGAYSVSATVHDLSELDLKAPGRFVFPVAIPTIVEKVDG